MIEAKVKRFKELWCPQKCFGRTDTQTVVITRTLRRTPGWTDGHSCYYQVTTGVRRDGRTHKQLLLPGHYGRTPGRTDTQSCYYEVTTGVRRDGRTHKQLLLPGHYGRTPDTQTVVITRSLRAYAGTDGHTNSCYYQDTTGVRRDGWTHKQLLLPGHYGRTPGKLHDTRIDLYT